MNTTFSALRTALRPIWPPSDQAGWRREEQMITPPPLKKNAQLEYVALALSDLIPYAVRLHFVLIILNIHTRRRDILPK